MGLMDRLFGSAAAPRAAQRSGPASVQPGAPSTQGVSSPQTVRKELVRVAVRDTLLHSGIPAAWIRAEPLTTAAPGREAGVHVRLVVQHWDVRLMQHAVALQDHLEKRLAALDPQAEEWLMGLSWQFALEDASACPPLPHPGSWTSSAGHPPAADSAAVPGSAPAAPVAGGNADVISGPTRIQKSGDDKRRELERMLSERDADFNREESDGSGFSKTEPMGFEKTQPMTAYEKTQAFDKTQPVQFDKTQPLRRPPSGS